MHQHSFRSDHVALLEGKAAKQHLRTLIKKIEQNINIAVIVSTDQFAQMVTSPLSAQSYSSFRTNSYKGTLQKKDETH